MFFWTLKEFGMVCDFFFGGGKWRGVVAVLGMGRNFGIRMCCEKMCFIQIKCLLGERKEMIEERSSRFKGSY